MLSEILEISGKILLTTFLAGLIGAERYIRRKGAGMRTHILVGVGSALIVLTSFHVFDIFSKVTTIDPTRMIAGIVTGIGFLCAGTIIRGGAGVSGLTTAASLWIVSCIGMSVAAGHYTAALIVSFFVFFVLVGLRTFEKKLSKYFDV